MTSDTPELETRRIANELRERGLTEDVIADVIARKILEQRQIWDEQANRVSKEDLARALGQQTGDQDAKDEQHLNELLEQLAGKTDIDQLRQTLAEELVTKNHLDTVLRNARRIVKKDLKLAHRETQSLIHKRIDSQTKWVVKWSTGLFIAGITILFLALRLAPHLQNGTP